MNDWLLAVLVLVGMLFLWDVWQLVRKWSVAVDRDQQIMDQLEDPDPEYPNMEEPHGVIVVDLTMSESDAVLRFVESFRQLKDQHDRNT